MNLEELKEDLLSKTEDGYFHVGKLFKNDKKAYWRRSFDDLFKYYRFKGVNEKMLLRALYELNFIGRLCSELRKVVFRIPRRIGRIAFFDNNNSSGYCPFEDKYIRDSKYTPTYLTKLFKSLDIKEDS